MKKFFLIALLCSGLSMVVGVPVDGLGIPSSDHLKSVRKPSSDDAAVSLHAAEQCELSAARAQYYDDLENRRLAYQVGVATTTLGGASAFNLAACKALRSRPALSLLPVAVALSVANIAVSVTSLCVADRVAFAIEKSCFMPIKKEF